MDSHAPTLHFMFGLFGKPSKKKFAELVLAGIKKAGGPTDFEYHEEENEIRRGRTRGFLANSWEMYRQASRAHRKIILENLVATMVTMNIHREEDFETVEADIAIAVRERALFNFSTFYWKLDDEHEPPKLVAEPISDWFAKTLVIDVPSHMSLVSEEQVTRWQKPTFELFALGLEKLRSAKPASFREDRGVYQGTWNDDYDSSRILIPGIFDDLPLNGDPVVVIPNRLTLLVAGSQDLDAIRRMLEKGEELFRNVPKAQNPAPLLVKDGVISDFSVAENSSIFNAVARAKKLAALSYYAEQKAALEKLYEKRQKDYFVATYTLNQRESGEYFSHGVWSKGVPTLLPKTDLVIFADPDKPEGETILARVKWSRVEQVLGGMMLDTQMFPQRFFVSEFPTKEQFEALVAERNG